MYSEEGGPGRGGGLRLAHILGCEIGALGSFLNVLPADASMAKSGKGKASSPKGNSNTAMVLIRWFMVIRGGGVGGGGAFFPPTWCFPAHRTHLLVAFPHEAFVFCGAPFGPRPIRPFSTNF